jgi:4-amino-4-deoxy-L-arabinose transferase-like glycosyltransferase
MRFSQNSFSRLIKVGGIAILCSSYLLFSCLHLKRPGLYYDEVLFANASLGNIDHSFVQYEWRVGCIHIPLMLMTFMGAVKAYLYAPIFWYFSPSPIAVRLPVIVVGLITLIITYQLVSRIFGKRAALIALALIAFDPGYIFHIRLDWGPVALMMLLKMGSLYCLAEFGLTRRTVYLKVGALLLGLGLYDKLNFSWYLLALALAAFLVWRKQCRELMTLQNIRLALAFFLLGCWPLLVFNLVTGFKTFKEPMIERQNASKVIRDKTNLLWTTLEGYAVYDLVNEHRPPPLDKTQIGKLSLRVDWIPAVLLRGSLLPWAVVVVPLIIGLLLFSPGVRGKQMLAFLLLMALLIQFQIYVTQRATGSHHIMMLYPFPHLLLAYVFALLTGSNFSWFEHRVRLRRPSTLQPPPRWPHWSCRMLL